VTVRRGVRRIGRDSGDTVPPSARSADPAVWTRAGRGPDTWCRRGRQEHRRPVPAAAAAAAAAAVSRSRRAVVVGLRQPLTARERHSTAVRALGRCPHLVPPIDPSGGHPAADFLALGRHNSLAVPSVPSVLKKEYIGQEKERRVSESEEGGSSDRTGQRGQGGCQREEGRPSGVDAGWTRAGHMVPAPVATRRGGGAASPRRRLVRASAHGRSLARRGADRLSAPWRACLVPCTALASNARRWAGRVSGARAASREAYLAYVRRTRRT
jgi:hypothetical protein